MIWKNLLFVCLGNICRSPAAEAIMKKKLEKTGYARNIVCDSAGIIGFHTSKPADARMRKLANRRGYAVKSRSRKVNPEIDFDRYDMIIGMADENINDLKALARSEEDCKKIFRMTDFFTRFKYKYIPDPYYGGNEGFEFVLDLLEDACGGLIEHLDRQNQIQ